MTHIIKNDVSIIGNLTCATIDSGTYTPTIGSPTIAFSPFGATNYGYWQKVGKQYFVTGTIAWNGKNSAVAGDEINVSLPFTTSTDTSITYSVTIGYVKGMNITTQLLATLGANANFFKFVDLVSGGTPTTKIISDIAAVGDLRFSVNFYVD